MKITALLFTLVLCLTSCENPPLVDIMYRFMVANNSSEDVYVDIADLGAERHYPDTLLPSSSATFRKIAPNRVGYFDSRIPWEEEIKNLPSDTLSIFFIDGSTFENEQWSTIRDEYLVLERYDLSIEDFEKSSNFTIPYPLK